MDKRTRRIWFYLADKAWRAFVVGCFGIASAYALTEIIRYATTSVPS